MEKYAGAARIRSDYLPNTCYRHDFPILRNLGIGGLSTATVMVLSQTNTSRQQASTLIKSALIKAAVNL
jgi:hypothetical protein